jgi:hypothetical protein
MDPYSKLQQQIKYYEYVENQSKNPVDYTNLPYTEEDLNPMVRVLAEKIFSYSKNNLDINLSGIFIDPDIMEPVDLFSVMIEFIMYGLNIITKGQKTLFDITDQFEDIIYDIKKYLKSVGFDMKIDEVFGLDSHLQYDGNTCYCRIVPKPNNYLVVKNDWNILNYRIIINNDYKHSTNSSIETFQAWFINKNKKVFTINTTFAKHMYNNTRCDT